MTARRADFEPEAGQQLYALVESCRKPEVLWDKLRTGKYDWLGLRRGGRFVIGRPRLSAVVAFDDEAVETDPPTCTAWRSAGRSTAEPATKVIPARRRPAPLRARHRGRPGHPLAELRDLEGPADRRRGARRGASGGADLAPDRLAPVVWGSRLARGELSGYDRAGSHPDRAAARAASGRGRGGHRRRRDDRGGGGGVVGGCVVPPSGSGACLRTGGS